MVLSLRRFKSHFGSRSSLNFLEDETKLAKNLSENQVNLEDFKLLSFIDTPIKHQSRNCEKSTSIKLYHSKYNHSDHPVVIKLIHLDNEDDSIQNVIHEIEMLKCIKHINVLPLLTSFLKDQDLYVVMSAAQYGSLDMWRRPVGICETAVALVIRDVLTGLVYLHKQGIIHRAICGAHILINSNGTCLLTGLKYSISMMREGKLQSSIYDFPNFPSKLLNITAPEILRQNMHGYNAKSDIYSLGILCCELANGCVPFDDIESTEMLLDKLTGNFPRPLDSTCEEIQSFTPESLTPEMLEKYNAYRTRTFSQGFHYFTIEQCLTYDFHLRPTALELLNCSFIKQTIKRSHRKLLELLQSGPSSNRMPINNNPSSNHSSKESIVFDSKSSNVESNIEWIW